MKRRHIALVIALILLAGVDGWQSSAAPFTENFNALDAELQQRAASLTNATTRLERHQRCAVRRALRKLSKPSRSFLRDLKLTVALWRILVRGFPDEFITSPPTNSLGYLLDGVVDGLTEDTRFRLDSFAGEASGRLLDSCQDEVIARMQHVEMLLQEVTALTNLVDSIHLLKFTSRALDRILALNCIDWGPQYCSCSGFCYQEPPAPVLVGTFPYWVRAATFVATDGSFNLVAENKCYEGPCSARSIAIVLEAGVNGPGEYPITPGNASYHRSRYPCQPINENYLSTTGTVVISALDLTNRVVSGTFWFIAIGTGDTFGTIYQTNGTFTVTNLNLTP